MTTHGDTAWPFSPVGWDLLTPNGHHSIPGRLLAHFACSRLR